MGRGISKHTLNILASIFLSLTPLQAGEYKFSDFRNKTEYTIPDAYRIAHEGNLYYCFPFTYPEATGHLNQLYLVVDKDDNIVTNPELVDDVVYSGRLMHYMHNDRLTSELKNKSDRYERCYNDAMIGEFVLDGLRLAEEIEASLLVHGTSLKANVVAETRDLPKVAIETFAEKMFTKATLYALFGEDPKNTDRNYRRELYNVVRRSGSTLDSVATVLEAIRSENFIASDDANELQDVIIDARSNAYGALHALKHHYGNVYAFLNQVGQPIVKGVTSVDLEEFLTTYGPSLTVFENSWNGMRTSMEEDFGMVHVDDKVAMTIDIVDDVLGD